MSVNIDHLVEQINKEIQKQNANHEVSKILLKSISKKEGIHANTEECYFKEIDGHWKKICPED